MSKARLTFEDQLDTVPILNRQLTLTERDEGRRLEVEVRLRHRGIARFLQNLFKLSPTRSYELQGIGLQVFKRIDGRQTFAELIDGFAAEHKLTFLEARSLLMQYVHILMQRGLLGVAVKKSTLGIGNEGEVKSSH